MNGDIKYDVESDGTNKPDYISNKPEWKNCEKKRDKKWDNKKYTKFKKHVKF